MSAWPKVELKEVAEIAAGDSAPQGAANFAPDGKPFVRMQDVGRYGRTDNLTETTDKVTDAVSAKLKLFRKGSILVPKSGASIRLNHRAILGIDAHVVSHLAVITPRSTVNARFLYYWLSCVDMATVAPKSDYPSLRLPDLARVPVPLPPLAEQKRIVRILDEAEALRRLQTQASARIECAATAIFHEMLNEAPKVTEAPLKELLSRIDSGWSPVCDDEPATFSQWGILKLGAVTSGKYNETENKRLLPAETPRIELEVKAGDVLFTRKNTRDLVAAVAYVWETRPRLMMSDLIFRLVPSDPRRLNPVYLTYALKEPNKRREVQSLASGAAGSMPNISKSRLFGVCIPLVSPVLQEKFSARVAAIRDLESAQSTSRQRLDALFQSLLHRAFQGEL